MAGKNPIDAVIQAANSEAGKQSNPEAMTNRELRTSFDASNENFARVAMELSVLLSQKNKAYGDSYYKAGEFLKLIYPNGLKPENYDDALTLVRMFDKMARIATKKDALGESPYRDLAGYAILAITREKNQKA